MKMRWARTVLLAAICLAGFAGCKHCCRNRCGTVPDACPPAGQRVPPGVLPPAPAEALQTTPVQPPPPPGPAAPGPAAPFAPPPPSPAGVSGYGPPPTSVDARWQPVPGPGVRLSPPETPAAPLPRDNVRLQPPITTTEPPPSRPSIGEAREPSALLPVGIPQFAVAREGVTSGLKPNPEGLDWLKSNGYRTVLRIRSPGTDDTTERQAAESRGLSFLSLTVSPESLPQASEEFNRIVNHKPNHPLFVYDNEGARVGSLWYLYFRVVDRLPDDAARRKAATLGLREDSQGEAGTLWVAIQQYLRGLRP